ncbi:hypothetical protein GCM10023321_65790 [Pseudonocardia eucalypti]|uniref:Secreted protein n=1 Tax=Pseudonocardia eucalypti TaxID=648755 RepID=A0ABP9QZJ8_9PSEU|nr:hypothetical protein [Pseudonocardia eucalypti]
MPIRSPKGRGAAYRVFWQWPLRSPARLFGCVVALLALAIGANAAFGLLPSKAERGGVFGSARHAAPGSSGTAPGATGLAPTEGQPNRLPPVAELTPRALPPAQAPPAALTVAAKWTKAWAHHPPGTSTASWVTGLRPYTTEEYLGVLSTVDPANIPATAVTGPARATVVAPSSVRVQVPTDAVNLVVLVVNTGGEWRVAGYDRAETANTR